MGVDLYSGSSIESGLSALPPLVMFEDHDLLVVEKPPGWNTHSPAPYVGEGLYDWLRHREPKWAGLAIVHRLDKETSGLMVFTKTPLASKSLTLQFTERRVNKEYVFLTEKCPVGDRFESIAPIARAGDRYVCRPEGQTAKTVFEPVAAVVLGSRVRKVRALPLTGRTHQIRVHAAALGMPVLGDSLYGGGPGVRLFLHAARLEFDHPVSGQRIGFESDPLWTEATLGKPAG